MVRSSHYYRKQTAQRQTWEELSRKSKWLHWQEIIDVLRMQRESYEVPPDVVSPKYKSAYGIRYFYSTHLCHQGMLLNSLIFEWCEHSHLFPTLPTPSDTEKNVLYIATDDYVARLYLGSFKTLKTAGTQKIILSKSHQYFIRQIQKYLKNIRPRLLCGDPRMKARWFS